MTYFTDCQTLRDLKAAYRRAAMANHPDRGGSEDAMKAINLAYEKAFARLQASDTREAENSREASEAPGEFINIINLLIKLKGIDLELCGMWIWISGNTRPHKDTLKTAGCRWASKKKMWYWHPAGWESNGRGKTSMAQIRDKYGSIQFRADGSESECQREKITA